MLAPVSNHQATSHDQQRQKENEDRCAGVDIVIQQINRRVVAELPESCAAGIAELTLPPEVEREFGPDEEKESADVASKVKPVVAVVKHCGAQVIGAVALDMVMLDVVVVVRVPGMPEHRV